MTNITTYYDALTLQDWTTLYNAVAPYPITKGFTDMNRARDTTLALLVRNNITPNWIERHAPVIHSKLRHRRTATQAPAPEPQAPTPAPKAKRPSSAPRGVSKAQKITRLMQTPPFQPGTARYERMEAMKTGQTVQEYLDATPGASMKNIQIGIEKGFISLAD